MRKALPLVIAGIIFCLFALAHVFRLIYHWEVTFNGSVVPMSISYCAIIISGILAIWMFIAACIK